MGGRAERVGGLLLRELSSLLLRGAKDPRLRGVHFTRVQVSEDLQHAKVYFSRLGALEGLEEALQGLESARGFLRASLRKSLRLRRIPSLVFIPDHSLAEGDRVQRLLRGLGGGAP
ncbi:MAG: 30S ribosome-binding factor RbfA [Nitrospinota bacterium]